MKSLKLQHSNVKSNVKTDEVVTQSNVLVSYSINCTSWTILYKACLNEPLENMLEHKTFH